MFSEPTVLILGAGASSDFGFPLGRELSEEIIDFLNNSDRAFWGDYYNSLNYADSSKRIIDGLLCTNTIDEYLSVDSDEKVTLLAKMCIVKIILEAEYESKSTNTVLQCKNSNGNWYNILWEMIRKGFDIKNCRKIFDKKQNPFTVITFNYDRSLEYYIFHMLVKTFKLTYREATVFMKGFNIIHPYGTPKGLKIIDYDGKSGSAIEVKHTNNVIFTETIAGDSHYIGENITDEYYNIYGYKIVDRQVAIGADKLSSNTAYIKTYNEIIDKSQMLEEIQKYINNANKFIFMGFGYIDQNMKIIKPKILLRDHKNIKGTVIGKSENEVKIITNALERCYNASSVSMEKLDCFSLVNDFKYEYIIYDI